LQKFQVFSQLNRLIELFVKFVLSGFAGIKKFLEHRKVVKQFFDFPVFGNPTFFVLNIL
jgi:hypothetical protein